jgi:hypothetical protein
MVAVRCRPAVLLDCDTRATKHDIRPPPRNADPCWLHGHRGADACYEHGHEVAQLLIEYVEGP